MLFNGWSLLFIAFIFVRSHSPIISLQWARDSGNNVLKEDLDIPGNIGRSE